MAASIAVILVALTLNEPLSHDSIHTVVSVTVNGNHFMIPQDYLPRWGKLRPKETKTVALNLEAIWPAMAPFIDPEDNGSIYTRYHDKLGILIDPAGSNTEKEQQDFLRKISEGWLNKRVSAGEKFGLARFVYKNIEQVKRSGTTATYDAQDVFIASSLDKMETMIICSPEFEPDPDSETAAQMRRAGKFVANPGCEQHFFVPSMKNIRVQVNYFRTHLKDWKKIQQSVVQLLHSFVIVQSTTPRPNAVNLNP